MVSSVLRLAPSADGVSIWSSDIFGGTGAARVRDFLSRAFSVAEVADVELQRASSFGRINYGNVADPAQVWKKLSRAISRPEATTPRVETDTLFLELPSARRIRVSRIGRALSTWRVRHRSQDRLSIWHPLLRNRRDLVFRLEEELASIAGVEDFRASAIAAGVSIRFDSNALTAEHLARALEKAWPRLLEGTERPLSQKRLFAAVGLAGLSFTGQYLVPPLRRLGVAGVTLYSAPNVIQAAKDLRHGRVGLPALYSTGLAFTLASGMPFAASAVAVLMQLWPQLARRKFIRSRRRLIARAHRRAAWARLLAPHGSEVEVHVDELRAGDRIAVRRGETVPVAATVESGSATLVNGAVLGSDPIEDRFAGDTVAAGAFVREGQLTLRVAQATPAPALAELLPYSALSSLPSLQEAERIADRNAKPALAAALASLAATRTLRPSQVLIRPDYATAPRLSAQLSVLHGIAEALHTGIVFKNPAALDRLARADLYVLDDTADLGRKRFEVASVQPVNGTAVDALIGYALAVRPTRSEYTRALASYAEQRAIRPAEAANIRREAGVVRFQDAQGHAIGVASAKYVAAKNPEAARGPGDALYVLRDNQVIGLVSFARKAEGAAKQVVAVLSDRTPVVHLSRRTQAETDALARELGIERAHGALSAAAKLEHLRGFGRKLVWIGDGSDPVNHAAIAASTVSISVAPLSNRPDRADILLPQRGLEGVPDALALARAHRARLARDYRTVYAVNLLGASGALSSRFSGLYAGLLSNAGTAWIYAQHARALDRLATAAEAERIRARRSAR